MIRSRPFDDSPNWSAGVYLTKVGSLSCCFLISDGLCAADAPEIKIASASLVFSVCRSTSSAEGRAKVKSLVSMRSRKGIRSLKEVAMVSTVIRNVVVGIKFSSNNVRGTEKKSCQPSGKIILAPINLTSLWNLLEPTKPA